MLQKQKFTDLEIAELRSYLSSLKTQDPDKLNQLVPGYQNYSSIEAARIERTDLMERLHNHHQATMAHQPLLFESAENMRATLKHILTNNEGKALYSLHQADDDIINLVAMYFDFLLQDEDLPQQSKALINRLQLPILRVALNDIHFFNNAQHPARTLIEFIAESTSGWEKDTENGDIKSEFYDLFNSIVADIESNYYFNNQVFNENLQRLINASAKLIDMPNDTGSADSTSVEHIEEIEKTQTIESPTSINLAELITEKLNAAAPPVIVESFIRTHWHKALIAIQNNQGANSSALDEAIQIIDDLIWVSLKDSPSKTTTRYQTIKPDLFTRLALGLQQANLNDSDYRSDLEALEDTLDALYAESSEAQELTGLERQQIQLTKRIQEAITTVENLPINSWLYYTCLRTGKTKKCKLTERKKHSDHYIFIDWLGIKAQVSSKVEFARDLQGGRVEIIASPSAIDRVIDRAHTLLGITKE